MSISGRQTGRDADEMRETRCRCGRTGGLVAVILAILAIGLILVCVWVIRKEQGLVQTHEQATCAFKNVTRHGLAMCQYCYTGYDTDVRDGKTLTVSRIRCRSTNFPCVRVSVFYQQTDGGPIHTGVLDDSNPTRVFLKKCSFSSCQPEFQDNEKAVHDFVSRWRDIPTRRCLWDRQNPSKVLNDSFVEYELAIQGVIWGAVILLSCVAFIIGHWISNYMQDRRRNPTSWRFGAYGAEDAYGAEEPPGTARPPGTANPHGAARPPGTASPYRGRGRAPGVRVTLNWKRHQETEPPTGPWTKTGEWKRKQDRECRTTLI